MKAGNNGCKHKYLPLQQKTDVITYCCIYCSDITFVSAPPGKMLPEYEEYAWRGNRKRKNNGARHTRLTEEEKEVIHKRITGYEPGTRFTSEDIKYKSGINVPASTIGVYISCNGEKLRVKKSGIEHNVSIWERGCVT